jgi:YHS domain-containing protein
VEAFLYFLLWVAVSMLALRFGIAASASHHRRNRTAGSASGRSANLRWVPPETDTDPVCGKAVDPAQAKSSVYDGYVYYFCSRECRERFETAQETYLRPATSNRVTEAGGQR